MISKRDLAAAALGLGLAVLAACGGRDDGSSAFDVRPARAALERMLPPQLTSQIELQPLAPDAPGMDRIELGGGDGRIRVGGTSPATLLAGVHWYLKEFAQVSITWNGDSLSRLDGELPAPRPGWVKRALVAHRFAGNDTWSAYTGPYWDFARWQREIDVLAASGINEVLVYVGGASVYYETFRELGFDDRALREWIPLPAHQPWFLLHNMHGITEPISADLLTEQAALGRRVADYARSLGVTPVLPGYYGMVPPGFAERFPEAHVLDQGTYLGTTVPQSPQLDPTDPRFAQVAATFYRHSERLLGASVAYMATPYHEGGVPGDTPLSAQYAAIQAAMQEAQPGSTWVLLAWFLTPTLPRGVAGTDPAHVLVLDGTTDSFLPIDPDTALDRRPFALGSIWQFGGRTHMSAWLPGLLDSFRAHLARPESALAGVALLPEAGDDDPAAFAFLTELAWEVPSDLETWLRAFATRRYGGTDVHAEAAWQILGSTVYGPANVPTVVTTLEPSDPFVTVPSLAAPIERSPVRSDARLDTALEELLLVEPDLRTTSAYAYDLMDVARQVLGNHAYDLHDDMVAATAGGDADGLERLGATWLSWLALADEIAGTDAQNRAGRYLHEARRSGPAAVLDALQLVTVWTGLAPPGPLLSEYANRGWHGLYGTYYRPRWEIYLRDAVQALRAGRPLPVFDAFPFGDAWTRSPPELGAAPEGDVVDVARRILAAVRTAPGGGGREVVDDGQGTRRRGPSGAAVALMPPRSTADWTSVGFSRSSNPLSGHAAASPPKSIPRNAKHRPSCEDVSATGSCAPSAGVRRVRSRPAASAAFSSPPRTRATSTSSSCSRSPWPSSCACAGSGSTPCSASPWAS